MPEGARRWARSLRTASRLPARELARTAQAWLLLPCIGLGLRRFGLARCQARLAAWSPAPTSGAASEDPQAASLAAAVDRAARHAPGGASCLPRSLLLWWLLRRRRQDPLLVIGVRRPEEALAAHAWVELGGRVLNDSPDVRQRFAAFERPIKPPTGA